jgi:sigma-E factor negative regulatory protein RseA
MNTPAVDTLASELTSAQAQAISALADGHLHSDELAQTLALLGGEGQAASQARATWHAHHVIGDALRGGAASLATNARGDAAFVHALRARLAQEPLQQGLEDNVNAIKLIANTQANTPGYSQFGLNNQPRSGAEPSQPPQQQAAANDSFWKLAAGFASVVAVGALAWNLLSIGQSGQGSGAQIAQNPNNATVTSAAQPAGAQPQVVLVATPQGDILRDARLVQMMAAHKQIGGVSGLQMPSGFLRNATFTPSQP